MNPDYFKYSYATYKDIHYNTAKEPTYASPEIYFRETILEKLDSLKNRIEYKTLPTINALKNSDWRYVDDTFNLMIEDNDFYPSKQIFKKMNVLWKKYK